MRIFSKEAVICLIRATGQKSEQIFFDEEERCVYVDGWRTDYGDEEGTVIAKVFVDTKEVEYLIEDGKTDSYVQEEISLVMNDIEKGNYKNDNLNEVDSLIENAMKKAQEQSAKKSMRHETVKTGGFGRE